ncbi:asparagine synthetase [Candidatus Woesearchaeota archaeon]|nr:asparagine synthetase [Candidatus Woesearchaeota archaeon]MBT5272504.1 asparagine synthetase [Candidatus Woesearchaeota archaeon]MBT6041488.1 asparagine synthetase [Candidatus Woesearchaeota archaeon]MBT6336366.1 asparagine synthetase [Candidatus Woesearchaeota archaeon]MBT7928268.1 asparagine synthetase [Candidatus Woesearchaeota archaeon]
MLKIEKPIHKIADKISSKEMDAILRIQSCALKAIHDFMYSREILQLMPVMLSTITDPLCHSVYDAKIKYMEQELMLTKSMILHKQMALMSDSRKAIYIISPNIRLEKEECKDSGRHLIEFSQVDFEFKDVKKEFIKDFMEDLFISVISRVKEDCKKELEALGRDLVIPTKPFARISTKDAIRLGEEFETILSEKATEPFWLLDHEREFYDKEHEEKSKVYLNYDLVYPEGFGEALSGGEREHEHEKIIERMIRSGTKPEHYTEYLELAKHGKLPKTAGGGFGVERLLRFLTGKKDIADVCLFAKKPGMKVLI